ncbi:AAA family ATPase [Candidatus Lokiarchaeum ossiferum]|uniref:AAA family ATPase n=1 Tax=Candidatus Lokiarchaeum ossiferum TaxID=2951803 RepID=UPI00352DB681
MSTNIQKVHYQPPARIIPEPEFPFTLSLFKVEICLPMAPVVIFTGENGTGKSTLLEGIAGNLNLPTLGELSIQKDPCLRHAMKLANQLRIVQMKKSHRGFFMRAEDFFAYLKRIELEREENTAQLHRIDNEYKNRSRWAQIQAKTVFKGSLAEIQHNFGENADGVSHGEGFMSIFRQRFVPKGIYLLDEPEAALSPLSQLGLIALIKNATESGAQFIIATHSPILMAIPKALLYNFQNNKISEIDFESSEHVQFYKDFLTNPQNFLRRL